MFSAMALRASAFSPVCGMGSIIGVPVVLKPPSFSRLSCAKAEVMQKLAAHDKMKASFLITVSSLVARWLASGTVGCDMRAVVWFELSGARAFALSDAA